MDINYLDLAAGGYLDVEKTAGFKEDVAGKSKAALNFVKGKGNAGVAYAKANPLKVGLGAAGATGLGAGVALGASQYKKRKNNMNNEIEVVASAIYDEIEKIAFKAPEYGSFNDVLSGAARANHDKANRFLKAEDAIKGAGRKVGNAAKGAGVAIKNNPGKAALVGTGVAGLGAGGALAYNKYRNREEPTTEEVLASMVYERALEKVAFNMDGVKQNALVAGQAAKQVLPGVLGGAAMGMGTGYLALNAREKQRRYGAGTTAEKDYDKRIDNTRAIYDANEYKGLGGRMSKNFDKKNLRFSEITDGTATNKDKLKYIALGK